MRNKFTPYVAIIIGLYVLFGGVPQLFTGGQALLTALIGNASQTQQPNHQIIANGQQAVIDAFAQRQSNLQVQLTATVSRVLPDDNKGSRHQRFILQLANGQTVLVAHNIDLAERVAGLSEGARVTLAGEYEWNDKGGVIHWTHHDPRGQHPGGWIQLGSQRYQ